MQGFGEGPFAGMGKLNLYYGTVKSTTGQRHVMAWANRSPACQTTS
jgi:hypothetical protein